MVVDILLVDGNMVSFNEFMDIDYKINSSDNNELILGNVSAASLSFSIWNEDKKYNAFRFKNSKLFLYKDIERTKKIGVFNIDKVVKNKNLLSFETTDNMTKTDEIFKGIQTPFNVFSLIVQICTQLGLQLRNTEEDFEYINTFYYDDTNLILGKKCREVLKLIGEVSGKYCIFDEEGQMFFNWYDLDTIKKEIPYNQLKTFARDEDLTYVSGISCVIDNEEITMGTKSSFDLVLSTDNPFLKPLSEDERKAILTDVYSKVYGMQYLSCDVGLSADDDIKIGDTLKVYDEDNNYYKIIASYININKIFSMKITSAGANPNRETKSSSSSGGGTSESGKIIYAKDENYKEINIRKSKEEINLNNLKIDGVTDKTSALLNYSLNFYFHSDNSNTINFKIYINDIVKTIPFKPYFGLNTFSWGEKLNLQVSLDGSPISNDIKITMDLSHNDLESDITIDIEKSVMSLFATGAKSAGGNLVTNLEFKEEIKRLSFRNETDLLTIGEFTDYVGDIITRLYLKNDIVENINVFDFRRQKMNIKNINESLE